jgi:hypothetical protein
LVRPRQLSLDECATLIEANRKTLEPIAEERLRDGPIYNPPSRKRYIVLGVTDLKPTRVQLINVIPAQPSANRSGIF